MSEKPSAKELASPVLLVRVTETYSLYLPAQAVSEVDGIVSSFWIPGKELLFQLSSYTRDDGDQTSAIRRLEGRMLSQAASWTISPGNNDTMAEAYCEDEGVGWSHLYRVWPNLAVYALISGEPNEVHDPECWPRKALSTIQLSSKPV